MLLIISYLYAKKMRMSDLYICLVSAVTAVLVRTLPARRSRWWRLAAVPLMMLALGLALRFCGRTYPGIHYPNSRFLNELLNGVGLFKTIGYGLVLAFGLVDAAVVLLSDFRQQQLAPVFVRSFSALRLVLLTLILLVIAYGFYYAVILWEHWNA